MTPLATAADALRRARHVVVFTGAGVSAESGIPTFRDALTGLWARFDAMSLATAEAFRRDPALVWGWYEWRRGEARHARPNAAHQAIAALAEHVPQVTVVTQNVDDLHERAGSVRPIHLHGSLHAPRCFDCGRPHPVSPDAAREPAGGRRLDPPRCLHCGGPVRPGVVWFGEALPQAAWQDAMAAAGACDLMLVVGTSGLVQPAASLPSAAAAHGADLIRIDPDPRSMDGTSGRHLVGKAGEVLPALVAAAWP